MNARRRVEKTRELLAAIGLEADRLKMVHLSSAMGRQFADEAERITDQVRALGPNRLRRDGAPAASEPIELAE